MKKIGIISLYYNNKNYGGLLQAYALARLMTDLNYNAEQLRWVFVDEENGVCKTRKKPFKPSIKVFKKVVVGILKKRLEKNLHKRAEAFKEFELHIPHSDKVYDRTNIKNYLNDYQGFAVGSDQVWNMQWFKEEYFFYNVLGKKYKFSYAASMPDTNISESQKIFIKKALKDFEAVSVREKKTADFLMDLCGIEVKQVLDPTLLLDSEQWDEVANKETVSGKYIFCYFLSREKIFRNAAKDFAKKMNLKIVTLPHLAGFIKADINFGDECLYKVSPADFITLIKNAEYVLTDSFHATVFSNIYKVKHFVFNRPDFEMSERITSLLDLFGTRERFFKADAEIMYNMKDRPVLINEQKLEEKKKESLEFLRANLEKV